MNHTKIYDSDSLTAPPPQALLRPGRIDRMIYVPLPDDNTRRQILNVRTIL